eukprot:Clim_evm1s96 gene=Clim_evmTU1s96
MSDDASNSPELTGDQLRRRFSRSQSFFRKRYMNEYNKNKVDSLKRGQTVLDFPSEERDRLVRDNERKENWKRWGPYLSERQWGTVREDYSENGDTWHSFPHDHARSRVYRWGEDGLLGVCDRQCRVAFSLALWNGNDNILKERLFGLTGPQGNHGEDVKELYYYLDSTPTHSWMKALYKYPMAAYPYKDLVEENGRRDRLAREYELQDTGVLDKDLYFDVEIRYAKETPDDILIEVQVTNRSKDTAHDLHIIPQAWFRNTWVWGIEDEAGTKRPCMKVLDKQAGAGPVIELWQSTLGYYQLAYDKASNGVEPEIIFTNNETNFKSLYGGDNKSQYTKDGFHEYIVNGKKEAVNPDRVGTKCGVYYKLQQVPPEETVVIRLRLSAKDEAPAAEQTFGTDFENTIETREFEADEFYASRFPRDLRRSSRTVARQAYAGLLWTKQFYSYDINVWLDGDPLSEVKPPEARKSGRNVDWRHLFNRDVISMPDKWEYPWYAAWDLAFHMIPFAKIDPFFTKKQLVLFLREWYMHPNGAIPAYEFNFGDVNPPVHAWACWRVYKMTGMRGDRDIDFLKRVFHKLMLNFTWWVNRTDPFGKNLFGGGFLGLDNIGIFDRSSPPPNVMLEQADGTAWMAFFCVTMLDMAMELAVEDPAYEDIATKFFEHFVAIAHAMNDDHGGLWNEEDGFYYDRFYRHGETGTLKIRSTVGLIPLYACLVLEDDVMQKLPNFTKRMRWFLKYKPKEAAEISCNIGPEKDFFHLLAIPSRKKLERIISYVVDENEFLSPYGLRSLSKYHQEHPYHFPHDANYSVGYVPGESNTGMFGGNSNWRGPIWFPVNYLLIEALERYHYYFGDDFKVECPKGSGQMMNLKEVSQEIAKRLSKLFLPSGEGNKHRPVYAGNEFYDKPENQELLQFFEFFHGCSGEGLGASHQTGWTALVVRCLDKFSSDAPQRIPRKSNDSLE